MISTKYFRNILLYVLLLLVLSTTVSAIGLAPASKDVLLTKNNFEYEIKIFNPDKEEGTFDIAASGDLADFITFSKDSVEFVKHKEFEIIKVNFNLPEIVDLKGGDYITRFVVQKRGEDIKDVVALIGVASKLKVTVPYDGAAVDIKLIAPNFIKNTKNNFAIEAQNKGVQDALNCKAVLEIFTPLNAKIVSLISEQRIISSKTKETFLIPWSGDAENGNYLAKTTLICDNLEVSKEAQFSIGSPEIVIDGLSVGDFTLGEIVKFDLILSSAWGEIIPGTYAKVELLKDDKQIMNTKTESKDVNPLTKTIIPFYIDTSGLQPGEYDLFITVNYLGKEISEVYNAYMTTNNVVLNSLSGNVIGGEGEGGKDASGPNSILIMAIVLIVIVNVVLVFKLLKKKQN